MLSISAISLLAAASAAQAATVLWDGSFDQFSTTADIDKWSWANQVGPYQWYIHGPGATSDYLALDASYMNPAGSESHGVKVTIDGTSNWNGQTMERTELIPQTTANLGTGNLLYHFSVKHSDENAPVSSLEHQVVFFESHFTELKYGVNGDDDLHWFVGGTSQWSTPFDADTWYNFAYDIDFSSSTVSLWTSTDAGELEKVAGPISASTSTNSADWHLGVLRLQTQNDVEDWYFSGVYVEDAPITTSIAGAA
ncbi:hypothetical protein BD626DRAFT_265901 [Schizophyllum amplum]|uniref:Glycoside hydrolase 131 catalytic N-terminal domain-containing protein n=1 Tax=Schizophyllum amplum TaxID=97359 RepID=A0A550CHF2_9AGAR|nr:hypothetical protein BD626DRAFT_265901 [Auriculariopsis ampla]